MYHNRILCIIFTLILAIGITIHTAEAAESITVETSNDVYYSGDFVVVFGKVQTIFENTPITIQILNQGNIVGIAQIKTAQDGTYVASFNASGPLWVNDGTYQVSIAYAAKTAQTTFEFFKQTIDKSSAAFPVNIPNSGSFDIGYTIRGGEVNDITMNNDRYSLLVEITVSSSGNIILKLPRENFDAQKSDGVDDSFIILISKENNESKNFAQVEYEEIATSSDSRTIRIPLEEGDKQIEVIGTY
ncbi:uncharacterized protein METZ01_LOCUS414224, partial [marine metagenome]